MDLDLAQYIFILYWVAPDEIALDRVGGDGSR